MKTNVRNGGGQPLTNRKAFTLIELLAVIVILAIIALIAVPIIISIINDSRENANKRSVELYGKAVENAIAKAQLNGTEIAAGDLSSTFLSTVQYDGSRVTCTTNKLYSDGSIYLAGCKVGSNTKEYTYGTEQTKKICTLVSDVDNDGTISVGDKYTCEVNQSTTYTFYILSIDTNNSINMIMERNICSDGTTTYTSENNYCQYAWHVGEDDNKYGPSTAMTELYNATKDWTNIQDMIMNYTDENNVTEKYKGYTSIITSNGVTTITGKHLATSTTIGTSTEPLKARLPKGSEVTGTGKCNLFFSNSDYGSCPAWLVDNLSYYDATRNQGSDKYSNNSANIRGTEMYNIAGYWLLSSKGGTEAHARYVAYNGRVYHRETSSFYGIRPVITVSTTDIG